MAAIILGSQFDTQVASVPLKDYNDPIVLGTNKVLVSNTDSASGYLIDKLTAGSNVTITKTNIGSNEALVIASSGGGGGSSIWGTITGVISNQTDLNTALNSKISSTQKGSVNGVATLDSAGTIPLSQIPSSIIGGLNIQGVWNASTNTPTLVSSVGTKGNVYIVNVAGTTNLNGITVWNIGDSAFFDGSRWQKITGQSVILSVFGRVGTVVATSGDYNADQITETATRVFVSPSQYTVLSNTSGTNTGDQYIFKSVKVSGQSDVVASTTTDSLTLVAGTNVTITTNNAAKSVTISSSGGTGTVQSVNNINPVNGNITLTQDNIGDGTTYKQVSATEKSTWNGKQEALVSGTNIKTINGSSILGSGNLDVGSSLTKAAYTDVNTGTDDAKYLTSLSVQNSKYGTETLVLRLSDTTSSVYVDATNPVNSFTFNSSYTLSSIILDARIAPTGSILRYDVKKNGTSIFTTKISIDAGEYSSTTASTPYVLTGTISFVAGDTITVFCNLIGSTLTGSDIKMTFLLTK